MNTNIDNSRGQMNYEYAEDNTKRIIKVIGVGGGGGNAVTTMYKNETIKGVTFLLCNTDEQALNNSPVPDKLVLGPTKTKGLGAGNKPEIAREATEESAQEIINKITTDDTEMVFITAGMGGGTGTGGAPIVGRLAKEAGKLTVGIVTIPFRFEGRPKILQALEGVRNLQENVDALLIINNERLIEIHGNLPVRQSFQIADATLSNAARGISDMINQFGITNLDFADVKTTLKDGGIAVISSGKGSGNNRTRMAIEEALKSPLLNNNSIKRAKKLLIALYSSEEDEVLTEEFNVITEFTETITEEYNSKFGYFIDPELEKGELKITILASGFGYEDTIHSVQGISADTSISSQDRSAKRAEDDERIKRYYGEEPIGHKGKTRRPLILTLNELDNEEILLIAEEQPAFNRDLRTIEDIRKRYTSISHKDEQAERILDTEHSTPLTKNSIEDNSNTIYF